MSRSFLPVEKGIPIPPLKRGGRPRGSKQVNFPWREMEVGDSFLIPGRTHLHNATPRRSAVAAGKAVKGIEERSYTSRLMPEGVRVWRTS